MHGMRAHRTVSTVDEYLTKVKMFILEILNSNLYGIEVDKLKKSLEDKMGNRFEYKNFQAESF